MNHHVKIAARAPQDSPFVEFWNDVLAPKFITYKHILVDGLSHHSEAIFPTLPVEEGQRILDVGCGFGDTALLLADKVGPSGHVLGIDCCDAFLDHARDEARQRNVANVTFQRGDAELALPAGEFDLVFARFGTMFFANPVAAFRNMRKSLKPGGRIVHIVWRNRTDNPWLSMAKDIVLRFLPAPGEDASSCGPGPFSLADENHTRTLMKCAGYEDIQFQRVDAPVMIGKTVSEAIGFQLALGPAGEVFREAGVQGENKRSEIETALAEAIGQQPIAQDGIVMASSSWVISAFNPIS